MANRVWVKRVEDWRKSGLSSVAFAEGKGFSGGGLRSMAHVLGEEPGSKEIRLARVVRPQRSPPPPTPPMGRAAVVVPGAAITVVIDGARVEVGPGASREVLAMVLDALAERSRG